MTTLEKVKKLEKYLTVNNSVVDPIIETTIDKLLTREFNRLVELKFRLTNDLAKFEKHYDMNSEDFYQRYEKGELGDEMDFVEWAATIEMLNNLKQRLALLEATAN